MIFPLNLFISLLLLRVTYAVFKQKLSPRHEVTLAIEVEGSNYVKN